MSRQLAYFLASNWYNITDFLKDPKTEEERNRLTDLADALNNIQMDRGDLRLEGLLEYIDAILAKFRLKENEIGE